MTQITWTGLIDLLSETKGRMVQNKWLRLRNEAIARRARGTWDTDYSDIVNELLG
jgi:hypothetical protein